MEHTPSWLIDLMNCCDTGTMHKHQAVILFIAVRTRNAALTEINVLHVALFPSV